MLGSPGHRVRFAGLPTASKNNKISLEYNLTLDKMMSQLLVLAALVATVTAFSPSSARRSTNSLKMSAEMLPGMF